MKKREGTFMRSNCSKAIILALFSTFLAVSIQQAGAQATTNVLVTLSTTWQYNQSGANLGTAWTAPGYNDTGAGWEGPGLPLFGFESNEAQYSGIGAPFNT